MPARTQRNVNTGRGWAGYMLAVQLIGGMALAFLLGWMMGSRSASRGRDSAVALPDQLTALQAATQNASQNDQIGSLEKQVKDLKKQNADLAKQKSELENKLSIAADVANRMNRTMQEERSKLDDAEWRARQASPGSGAGPGAVPPGAPPP